MKMMSEGESSLDEETVLMIICENPSEFLRETSENCPKDLPKPQGDKGR